MLVQLPCRLHTFPYWHVCTVSGTKTTTFHSSIPACSFAHPEAAFLPAVSPIILPIRLLHHSVLPETLRKSTHLCNGRCQFISTNTVKLKQKANATGKPVACYTPDFLSKIRNINRLFYLRLRRPPGPDFGALCGRSARLALRPAVYMHLQVYTTAVIFNFLSRTPRQIFSSTVYP